MDSVLDFHIKLYICFMERSNKSLYDIRYERIGRAVAAELQRNRHFRREVARLPLGSRILQLVDSGYDAKTDKPKTKLQRFFAFVGKLFKG
jgi:hypothetical protein